MPHPDGPTRLTKRPAPTAKLTSRTAVNSPAGVSNVLVTLSTWIIGLRFHTIGEGRMIASVA